MTIGYLWYSVVFRERYMKEANVKQEKEKENNKQNNWPLLFELAGRFLQACLITIFYNVLKSKDERDLILALTLAVFFSLSFQVQYYTSKVVWEQKTWNYFVIKVGEQFISLSTLSIIAYIFVK
ncbi:unnamed protein product (macronuclear) [Paramecium tetraurelia]|uniref:Uncharacterized protein n=1 Tax=Paramecium tetraurelia TaxID=5888 RepID=A0E038_PARTE|nr:uncharacterized protein GSPATT00021823001 [Paramecium tetraurelia]CAK88655.1 unnamed protein product [Paramecium tetraurelia]|eukprot:XP_001456052.1 hypothetical protein (macronuclear) [Paramecium tetraurelia strain d4-2]